MSMRYGEPILRDVKYTPRPGAYAILLDGSRILTTFQEAPDAEFQLPGGGIDPGESPVQALHREVFEETGWSISAPRKLGLYRRFCYMPDYDLWAEKICHIYIARPVMRRGTPTEAGHSAVWLSVPDAIRLLGNDGDADFLARL